MIVPTANRSKASVLVKVAFLDKDSSILPEMSAKVAFLQREITENEHTPVRAVPVSAIVKYKGHDSVYVLVGNRVKEKRIDTGRRLGNMVEIISGLETGDRIVLSPPDKIEDGKKVKIIED
jgi:multidrug efflux pump subunit AcrA (membrane-fusion protein)